MNSAIYLGFPPTKLRDRNSRLSLRPVRFRQACEYIRVHHRHHRPPQGWLFGIACSLGGNVVGVIAVGRPVARKFDDGVTCEVTRCCTDGTKNACSFLYGAARRAAKAMGYARIITYTLQSESQASLKAGGWKLVRFTKGRQWSHPRRPRQAADNLEPKILWECRLAANPESTH